MQKIVNNRLLKNFLSLFILQGSNYILPLITIPYIVRVIGVENFGLISFALSFIFFFVAFVDYGFYLTATSQISQNKNNQDKINEIFNSIIQIKILLILLSFIILNLLVFSFEKLYLNIELYYFTFLFLIGYSLFPVWFFQGLENMKYITIINIIGKLVYVILIFTFLNNKDDFLLIPLFNGISYLLIAIISQIIIRKKFNIKYKLQNINQIIFYLKDGWHIFLSNLSTTIYTTSPAFILGLFTTNMNVGYYSAAEKIIKALQGGLQPIFQTIYPHISSMCKHSPTQALFFIKKVTIIVSIITFSISIITFYFADKIVILVLGNQYIESIIILKILSFVPFFGSLNNMFGIQTMVNFGKKKELMKIIMIGSLIYFFSVVILAYYYQEVGSSIALLIVETFLPLAMITYIIKSDIKFK